MQAHHNGSALLGIDRTFKVFGDHGLTLRADATQTDRQHRWLASAGAVYEFCPWFVLESWANFPISGPNKPSFVVKVNFIFDWKKK